MALCGDGSKHPDELCDDGNQIAGDGCSPECVPSGMPYDCVDLLAQDNLEDWDDVRDLLLLADGSFIVAGHRDALTDRRGWVARYEASGAQRWSMDASTVNPSLRDIAALAGDEQTGIWALGLTGGFSEEDYLLRLDPDGNLVSATPIESEAGEHVDVFDIEATAAGVWLGGAHQPAGQVTTDTWLSLHDPTQSTLQDVLLEDHLGYNDTINIVIRDGEGVAVAATLSTSPHVDMDVLLMAETDIMVVWFDQYGNEQERTMIGPSPDPEFVRYASYLAVDESGRWFVGGSLSPFDFAQQTQGWVVQVGGNWTWTNTDSGFAGMVGVDNGIVIAANITTDSDTPYYLGWLAEFAWDGSARWEFGEVEAGEGIADYKHYSHRALTHDTGGHLRTAGTLFVPEEPALLRSCLVSR
jgi:cysteine-rich repeat protein